MATRESDERALEWLALRLRGLTCDQIARRYGVGRGSVSRLCRGIEHDDVRLSGENVAGWYA